jgi:hypothetical protein
MNCVKVSLSGVTSTIATLTEAFDRFCVPVAQSAQK